MRDLELSHERVLESPRVVSFRIGGDVEYVAVGRVEKYFTDLLDAEQPQHVLIDGQELTFVVTPFLGSLLFWQEGLRQRGGRLVLFGLNPSMGRVMSLLRLERVLTFCADRRSAMVALGVDSGGA